MTSEEDDCVPCTQTTATTAAPANVAATTTTTASPVTVTTTTTTTAATTDPASAYERDLAALVHMDTGVWGEGDQCALEEQLALDEHALEMAFVAAVDSDHDSLPTPPTKRHGCSFVASVLSSAAENTAVLSSTAENTSDSDELTMTVIKEDCVRHVVSDNSAGSSIAPVVIIDDSAGSGVSDDSAGSGSKQRAVAGKRRRQRGRQRGLPRTKVEGHGGHRAKAGRKPSPCPFDALKETIGRETPVTGLADIARLEGQGAHFKMKNEKNVQTGNLRTWTAEDTVGRHVFSLHDEGTFGKAKCYKRDGKRNVLKLTCSGVSACQFNACHARQQGLAVGKRCGCPNALPLEHTPCDFEIWAKNSAGDCIEVRHLHLHLYHAIPYHTTPYPRVYHTMSYHTTPYHTIPYHTIP